VEKIIKILIIFSSFNEESISNIQNSINNKENNNNNYLNENQKETSSSFNVRVAQSKNNYIDGPLKNLNCLLIFLILENISNKIENIPNFGNLKKSKRY